MTYQASHIKRRRSTKTEMEHLAEELLKLVEQAKPCTVRQIYYLATVQGLVEKTEAGYARVQRMLVDLRRDGALPYDWIADNTRWQRRPTTYRDPSEAIAEVARFYRKSLWTEADCYVEVWLEKDALSGVIWPVINDYDVPLMVARGYASLSFLHSAASYIDDLEVPAYIYHLGDYDPSGVDAGKKIEQTLRELAPRAEIHFERLAVKPEQIRAWNLPGRPTKTSDSRAKGFAPVSVELDAIPPNRLRRLVEVAIEQHLPDEQLKVLKVAEESERAWLQQWAARSEVPR